MFCLSRNIISRDFLTLFFPQNITPSAPVSHLKLFRRWLRICQNISVRNWLSKSLPLLSQHFSFNNTQFLSVYLKGLGEYSSLFLGFVSGCLKLARQYFLWLRGVSDSIEFWLSHVNYIAGSVLMTSLSLDQAVFNSPRLFYRGSSCLIWWCQRHCLIWLSCGNNTAKFLLGGVNGISEFWLSG
jgi:hypothetical protein